MIIMVDSFLFICLLKVGATRQDFSRNLTTMTGRPYDLII